MLLTLDIQHSCIEIQKGMIEAVKWNVDPPQIPLALINSIQDAITGILYANLEW